MNIYDAILRVDGWKDMPSSRLYELLTIASVEYVDRRNYTWGGIADVLGNDTSELLMNALETYGSRWAVHALSGIPGLQICRDDIQQKLYMLDQSGIVPGSAKLARHVKRMVSILEYGSIEASEDEVSQAQSEMILADNKRIIEDGWSDRLQAAREKLSLWDGDPNTEPPL